MKKIFVMIVFGLIMMGMIDKVILAQSITAKALVGENCLNDLDCNNGLICDSTSLQCVIKPYDCNKDNIGKQKCDNNSLLTCLKSGPTSLNEVISWTKPKICEFGCQDRINANDEAKCLNAKAKLRDLSYLYVYVTSTQGFLYSEQDFIPLFDPTIYDYVVELDQTYDKVAIKGYVDGSLRLQNDTTDDVLTITYGNTNLVWQDGDFDNDGAMEQGAMVTLTIAGDKYETSVYTFNFFVDQPVGASASSVLNSSSGIVVNSNTVVTATAASSNNNTVNAVVEANVAYIYTNHGFYSNSRARYSLDNKEYYNRAFNNGLHYTSSASGRNGSAQKLTFTNSNNGSVKVVPFAKSSGLIEGVPNNYVLAFQAKGPIPNNPNILEIDDFNFFLGDYQLKTSLTNGAELKVYLPNTGLQAYKTNAQNLATSVVTEVTINNNTCTKDTDCISKIDTCSCLPKCIAKAYVANLVGCDRECNQNIIPDGQNIGCRCINGICTNAKPMDHLD